MKLVVGLGNPGGEYSQNRHNVGFMFVDYLNSHFLGGNSWSKDKSLSAFVAKSFDKEIILAKPTTFMNASGKALITILQHYKIPKEGFVIVHDDLDIPLGLYKIQDGVGPKDHKGIASIEEKLGTSSFKRVRIGVDARSQEQKIPGPEYVLQDFSKGELTKINEVLEKSSKELLKIMNL